MPEADHKELEPTREAKEIFERWLAYVDREIEKHRTPQLRQEFVLANLHQLQLGAPKGGRLNFQLESELAFNVLQLSLDPKNITLEAEYDEGLDEEKYAPIKPLIYFWQMFDRSPVGLNHWLGFRFRAMLGRHIFKQIGENVKIFHGVEFTFGYNLTIEDNCVIHRHVILDDRGELIIRKGTCISDFTAICSDAKSCSTGEVGPTEVGPDASLPYHSVVMAGAPAGKGEEPDAMGIARPADKDPSAGEASDPGRGAGDPGNQHHD